MLAATTTFRGSNPQHDSGRERHSRWFPPMICGRMRAILHSGILGLACLVFSQPALGSLLDWTENSVDSFGLWDEFFDFETFQTVYPTSNQWTFTNVSGTGIDVTLVITRTVDPGSLVTFQDGYPATSTQPIQPEFPLNSPDARDYLQLAIDSFEPDAIVTVQFIFSEPVQNVSFTLYDVDFGPPILDGDDSEVRRFDDMVSDFYRKAGDSDFKHRPDASLSDYDDEYVLRHSSDPNDPGYWTFSGADQAPDTSGSDTPGEIGRGWVTINYGSAWGTEFGFTYSSGPEAPQFLNSQLHTIAMSDLTFSPIPEVGTLAGFGAFLFLAMGFEYRRRKRLARQPVDTGEL